MSVDSWSVVNATTSSHTNTASLLAPMDNTMDAWLWRILQKERNRDMIALLEDNLHSFVLDTKQSSLAFPPRNAFHRRVCYAVALRYGLDHRLEAGGSSVNPHVDNASGESVRLVLIKTPHSAPPSSRLAEFANGPPPIPSASMSSPSLFGPSPSCGPPSSSSACTSTTLPTDGDAGVTRPATFLRRPRTADGKAMRLPISSCAQAMSATGGATLKNITEEDYQRARARIFKISDASSGASSGGTISDGELETTNDDVGRVLREGSVAKGPVEGSRGFERRRNRRGASGGSGGSPDGMTARRGNSAVEEHVEDGQQRLDAMNGRVGRPVVIKMRTTRDGGRVGSSSGGNSAIGAISNTLNLATNGRRHGSEKNLGDLQDPDFDRSYIKWARRETLGAGGTAQPNGVGIPMFATHMMYPYGSTQALAHHALHGPGALALRSSMGISSGMAHPQYHHGGLVHTGGGGGMFGPMGQTQRVGATPGGNGLSDDFSRHTVSVGMTCAGSGGVPTAGFGRGLMSSGSMGVTHMNSNNYGVGSIHEGANMHMRGAASQPPHGVMSWTPQTMPMGMRAPSSPAYGLDSTVDFPPLR